jgi:hypothetical protein
MLLLPAKSILRAALLLLCVLCSTSVCAGNSLVFCARAPLLSATQKDHLLLLSHTIRQVLDDSGGEVAIISRSGLDLDRFNIRYSHAGISLKHSQNTPWSVRQLYYACDEGQSRIFDQGLSGFVMDQEEGKASFVSLLLLPQPEAASLAETALDNRQALALLGAQYSANAYAFSTQFQNCNQWLMELLAQAWGGLDPLAPARSTAQAWLQQQHYQPSDVDVKYRFMRWFSHFVPLVHNEDHPADKLAQNIYQVSMPTSIEGFVHTRVPATQRVEICLNKQQIILHRGWQAFGQRCESISSSDQIIPLS